MSREAANPWIERKHQGLLKGVGTSSWTPLQKARYDYSLTGKMNKLLAIQRFIEEDNEVLELYENCNVTTIERILSFKSVSDYLGIDIQNAKAIKINTGYDVQKIKSAVSDIIKNTPEVSAVYKEPEALSWVKKHICLTAPISTKPKEVASKVSLPAQKTSRNRAPKYSLDRKILIPKGTLDKSISNAPQRIKDIYIELTLMEVDKTVNAVAVLFRVFIDVALVEYMRAKRIKQTNSDGSPMSLKDRLFSVMDKLIDQAVKDSSGDAQKLREAKQAFRKISIYEITDFNGFVHRSNYHPDPRNLKTTWDNLQHPMQLLFSSL